MNTFRCIIGLQVPPIFGHNCSPVTVLLTPGITVYGQPFAKRFALCYWTVVRSVTLVYCGQTVGWTKTKLRTEVGLEPGQWPHCVRWDPALLPQKRANPNFRPMSRGQTDGWIKMKLGMEVGPGPANIVLWSGDPASPTKGREQPPHFGPCLLSPNDWMDQDATWHGGRPRLRPHY